MTLKRERERERESIRGGVQTIRMGSIQRCKSIFNTDGARVNWFKFSEIS